MGYNVAHAFLTSPASEVRNTVLFVSLSVALQSFCWTLPRFFSFFILYTVGRSPWTGDQPVARPLPTHRTTQTQSMRTQTSMAWMGFEPTIPAFERAKTVHAFDREGTVIGHTALLVLLITKRELSSRIVSIPCFPTVGLCVCMILAFVFESWICRSNVRTNKHRLRFRIGGRWALNKPIVNLDAVSCMLEGKSNHRILRSWLELDRSVCVLESVSRSKVLFTCVYAFHKLLNMLVTAFHVGRTCLKCSLNFRGVLNNFRTESTFHVSSSYRHSAVSDVHINGTGETSFGMQTFSRVD
jgi:hypothetical protein